MYCYLQRNFSYLFEQKCCKGNRKFLPNFILFHIIHLQHFPFLVGLAQVRAKNQELQTTLLKKILLLGKKNPIMCLGLLCYLVLHLVTSWNESEGVLELNKQLIQKTQKCRKIIEERNTSSLQGLSWGTAVPFGPLEN